MPLEPESFAEIFSFRFNFAFTIRNIQFDILMHYSTDDSFAFCVNSLNHLHRLAKRILNLWSACELFVLMTKKDRMNKREIAKEMGFEIPNCCQLYRFMNRSPFRKRALFKINDNAGKTRQKLKERALLKDVQCLIG